MLSDCGRSAYNADIIILAVSTPRTYEWLFLFFFVQFSQFRFVLESRAAAIKDRCSIDV